MQLNLRRRRGLAVICVAIFGLATAPGASAGAYIYWWQRNMPPNVPGYDHQPHNHTYNDLYFGPNAGWRSQVWEVTPAGYLHFSKSCVGNCFNAHPGYYFTYTYCANRDGSTHFVNSCMNRW